MFLRSLFRVSLAIAAASALVSPARADILIDDFSNPSPAVVYSIAPDANPTVIVNDLGGGITRTITLSVTSPVSPSTGALGGFVGDGFFSASFDVFSSGTAQIAYTFDTAQNFVVDADPSNPPGVLQFSGFGDSGFAADIPLTFDIATATGTLSYNGTLPLEAFPSQVEVPLADLTGTGDLTQVTGLTVTITGGQAADLVFDSLNVTTPIPAPPAALLALAALPVLGLRRMWRKPNAA